MTATADMSHGQSVQRLNTIREALEDLESRDELTNEDERSFDELTQEFAEVDAHRRQLERRSALERVRSAAKVSERGPAALKVSKGADDGYDLDPVLNPDSVEDCRFRNPWDVSEVRTFGRSPEQVKAEFRARALSAVEKMSGASDAIRKTATDFIERHDDGTGKMAKLALATSSPEYIRGWAKVSSGRAHMVSQAEQAALERALSLTDGAHGGYLVPFQLDPTVILTSDGSYNQIRQIARTVVATGDVWHGVSAGAVQWGWLGESTEASDNSPSFAQPSITVHKAAGFVPISFEAMDDAANITQEVGRLLAQGKDDLEAEAFINGTGSGQPLGIVTALDASGAQNVTGTLNGISADDVYALDNSLPARYRANASFLGNRTTYNAIRALDENGGGALWERIGNGMPAQLLGRPVYEAEAMATADAPGGTTDASLPGTDTTLVYGDFSSFVVVDRVGMSVEFIPNLMGANGRPTGQRGWFAHYRVGSGLTNAKGLRQLKA
jgi:HK97 family phage major capsid protein